MSNMPRPCGWRVLLKPMKAPDKIGSIYLSDDSKNATQFKMAVAEVIDMGPEAYTGERFIEPWCKPGDFVFIGKYAGSPLTYAGEDYKLVNDDEVIAVVPDPTKVIV